jgi:hypothetical protein
MHTMKTCPIISRQIQNYKVQAEFEAHTVSCFTVVFCFAWFYILKIEAMFHTTQCDIPEDRIIYRHRCEDLKPINTNSGF